MWMQSQVRWLLTRSKHRGKKRRKRRRKQKSARSDLLLMAPRNTLRIVTYNIHKCRGMDARVRPERVAAVLAELDPDIVALQEVVRGKRDDDQLVLIAKALGAKHFRFGATRNYRGADSGNAVVSRLPIISHEAY